MIASLMLLDACFPDYFTGSSHETLAVPVDSTTTARTLRQGIIREFADSTSGDAGFDGALSNLFTDVPDGKIIFPSLCAPNENDESQYAYFAIILEKDRT